MTESPLTIILRRSKMIILFGLITAIVGAGLSLLFPLRYGATMRLLIIQRGLSSVDPYTAIRASESIADNLGQIIYTTSFYDKVMATKFNIDHSVFKTDERQRRKQWQQMIDTQVEQGSGILQVTVYHTDPDQALEISRAIAYVLSQEGYKYVGGSGDLTISLIDDPLRSRFPVKPNILANAFTGFALGIMGGIAFSLISGRKREFYG